MKINSKKESFLCYCSKVTFHKFSENISNGKYSNLEEVCEKLGLAKKCAACLPNIEDEYFALSGVKKSIGNLTFKKSKTTILKKILNFFDYIFGDMLVSQYGFLPMIASKNIQTWLVISNLKPSCLNELVPSYQLSFQIFNKEGDKIVSFSELVKPNKCLKICLNSFLSKDPEKIENYFVKVKRQPLTKGLRGSTRTHFFYQANHSMATLHTQDGSSKNNFVSVITSNNNDKNLIFVMNPQKNKSKIQVCYESSKKKIPFTSFLLDSNASKLFEIKNTREGKGQKLLWSFNASSPVKSYLIIADKNFNRISVDHL